MRELVYTMFITNNRATFHLWWKKKLVKHKKVSKYYKNDCKSIYASSMWFIFRFHHYFHHNDWSHNLMNLDTPVFSLIFENMSCYFCLITWIIWIIFKQQRFILRMLLTICLSFLPIWIFWRCLYKSVAYKKKCIEGLLKNTLGRVGRN